jgi:hypothetical protein
MASLGAASANDLAVEPRADFPCGTAHSSFRVGGVSVLVESEDRADVVLDAPLKPFGVANCEADITLRIEWVDDLGPGASDKLFDSGSIWRLYQSEAGLEFDFRAPVFGEQPYKRLLIDPRFTSGILQMSRNCPAEWSEIGGALGYPLDELLIMHRLTQEKAIELHSCGMVRADGTGNLFVGHSGAGKSTTTRLWTAREDVEVLSDDRIIVRRDEVQLDTELGSKTTMGTPLGGADRALGHEVLRLRDWSASRTSCSAQDDRGKKDCKMRMHGTPWHGEARYASPGSAPLARIFILEHGQGNVLTQLSRSQAVAELFARSFVPFHRHEYVDSALAFLEEVVDTIPCYRYAFEPNESAVERILNFRD